MHSQKSAIDMPSIVSDFGEETTAVTGRFTGATAQREAAPEISAHLGEVSGALSRVPTEAINQVVDIIRNCRDRGAFVYIAGNGGSASTASHWVNDLGKATKRSGRDPIKAMCLSDNTSWFSALSNDEGYERSFSGQLENFARPGDALICISASGNSANLLKAVSLARSKSVTTIGLLGFDGGALKDQVDCVVCVTSPKGAYELVEDLHSVICHAVTRSLIADRKDGHT